MPPEDLPAVARRLVDAVLRHAQAVADNDPDQRITAGPALTAALEAYGIAVVNAGSEPVDGVEDFDAWLGACVRNTKLTEESIAALHFEGQES